MKKKINIIIGLVIVLTLSFVTTNYSQSNTTAVAEIPFEFNIKNRTIEPGKYILTRQDDTGILWRLSGLTNNHHVFVSTNGIEAANYGKNAQLTFRRYGKTYFLAGIETPDYKIGFRKSSAERNAVKNMNLTSNEVNKGGKIKPEIVSINLGM